MSPKKISFIKNIDSKYLNLSWDNPETKIASYEIEL